MLAPSPVAVGLWALFLIGFVVVIKDFVAFFRLRHIPGPRVYAITDLALAVDAWHARAVHSINRLHQRYGPVVRIGPNQVSFNSLDALRTIYGAGSPFERTDFYRMFDTYGRPNLFTFASGKLHRDRKKLVSHMYANQTVLGAEFSELVKNKVAGFLQLLEHEQSQASEIFSSLHYFSFDAISEFVYGPKHGGTNALKPGHPDRALINDILDPARRRLAWSLVHYPTITKWIISRTGITESILIKLGLVPMRKPFTYTGIRQHALKAFYNFKAAYTESKGRVPESSVMGRLFKVRDAQNLGDLDIASECADHLLAGIDTTSDSLMFLVWALSLPQNAKYQVKLREAIARVAVDDRGVPHPKDLQQLPYLNAVLRESLRLYSPLPAFEPRTCPVDTVIDGYTVPAGTVVGMSPYCLHRIGDVYPHPEIFDPERWLDDEGNLIGESDARNKHFWAFSSGARMCIGMHLANAEMLTLVTAVYHKYQTRAKHPDTSPGITSRFEIFRDETTAKMVEHECWINFDLLKE